MAAAAWAGIEIDEFPALKKWEERMVRLISLFIFYFHACMVYSRSYFSLFLVWTRRRRDPLALCVYEVERTGIVQRTRQWRQGWLNMESCKYPALYPQPMPITLRQPP